MFKSSQITTSQKNKIITLDIDMNLDKIQSLLLIKIE